jgi:uncharacterized protein (TIGR02444 family)
VREACLDLQDRYGQNVCFLLWAVWAEMADPSRLAAAATTARAWDETVLSPLRDVRRGLKPAVPAIEDGARETLRREVKAAELRAEQVLLETLEAMTGARRGGVSALQALYAAAAAWGGSPTEDAVATLADALDLGLIGGGEDQHDDGRARRSHGRMDDDAADLEQGLRTRLALLIQEHADMDAAIQALAMSPLPDIQVVGRLKRKKLALKDEIVRIQDQLTPDIIA